MIKFESYDNWMNEGIKHLSGRTEEELLPWYNDLTPWEKANEGIRKNIFILFMKGLEEGADIEHDRYSLLRLASIRGNLKITKILIERGSDVNANDGHPLQLASSRGHNDVVKFLLKKGADVNLAPATYYGKSDRALALRRAAEEGHAETVKILLNAGSKLDDDILYRYRTDQFNSEIEQLLRPYIK